MESLRHYQNPNTHVFERLYPLQLVGKGKFPLLKKRNYILKKVDVDHSDYKTTMKCILTREIDDVGLKGSVVEVEKRLFRNVLYPSGDAVYASPENLEEFEKYRKASKEEGIDYEVKKIMKKLAGFHLRMFMNKDGGWEVNKTHIRVACRKLGLIVSDDNIILPAVPISKPGHFVFQLQLLDRVRTKVRATIYPSVNGEPVDPDIAYPPLWNNPPLDEDPLDFFKHSQDTAPHIES